MGARRARFKASPALEAKDISLSTLGRRSDADAVDALKELKGLGPWSAQMMLLFVIIDLMSSVLGMQA